MNPIVNNRWIQLVVACAVTALLAVVVGTIAGSSGGETVATPFGPVKLTTGGAVRRTGEGWIGQTQNLKGERPVVELELPLTGTEAVAAGWKDPVLCSEGRGKYFQKVAQDVPYILMYNLADDIIGIYHISMAEMPDACRVRDSRCNASGESPRRRRLPRSRSYRRSAPFSN